MSFALVMPQKGGCVHSPLQHHGEGPMKLCRRRQNHPAQPRACPDGAEQAPAGISSPEQVFQDHGNRVYQLAERMLGNACDAEDVTQEVLLQVLRKFDTFQGKASIATWLHRVTVNTVYALLRARSRSPLRLAGARLDHLANPRLDAETRSPDFQLVTQELRELLDSSIRCLPRHYREVFLLADFEERTNSEIARKLGLTLAAVKSRLHRARRMLRTSLQCHFPETH
jgi:RNA polymerase sigma-70 factor (ECF subfamily)